MTSLTVPIPAPGGFLELLAAGTVSAQLLAEFGLLLVLLSAMATIAWRIGLSSAPLFLLAGLLIGALAPEDMQSSDFLDISAGVGVTLLLLALGLEFSAEEFTQTMRRHAPSGVVDFALNAPPGFVAGLLLGLDWRGALAMAGVTWISSSGIVSKLLSDLGRVGYRETPSVLSILVLEDVAMAGYLPLIGVILVGGSLLVGIGGATAAVVVTLLVIKLTQRAGGVAARFFAHEDDEQILLRVLGVTFLVAGLAEAVQVSSAVGAFLVGLAIPNPAARRVRVLLRPLRDLFAAVFFLSFGLSTDLAETLPHLPAAAALAVVTILTKMGTAWFAAGRDGVSPRGRFRAGTALVARGEFSVVIAGLAVSAGYGVIGPFASAYVLIVAVLGPVLARSSDWWADRIVGRSVSSPRPPELAPRD